MPDIAAADRIRRLFIILERKAALAIEAARLETEIKEIETVSHKFGKNLVSAAKLLSLAPKVFKGSSQAVKCDILKIACLNPLLNEGEPLFTAASPFNLFSENRSVPSGAGGGT
ncbi:MAG: hypothetical protein ABW189_08910 [Rickettsiales bacterium]